MVLCGCSGKQTQNRLRSASSPYLREHADNPVDWYEWGDEALAKAKKENKPLLISIGYASCHWCHEMEKESFMDTAVARIMNENFVCIKVDREERPDIDQVYMNALQLLTGNGGWPLNAFALPGGKPFFAGTYYPKKQWIGLLSGISKAYTNQQNLVVTQANALLNGIAEQDRLGVDNARVDEHAGASYAALYDSIYNQADLMNGGLKGGQKFPTPAFAEFLLQDFYTTHKKGSLNVAATTLRNMALGGIYDHIGGGFARYATDSLWKIPHFEKMLYDNAQLVSVYAHAYQLTKDEFYKNIMTETLGFIEHTLAAPGGGYYSSLNADTKAGEGMYYAWSRKDIVTAAAGNELVAEYFHATSQGNWQPGNNILYATQTTAAFAKEKNLDTAAFSKTLAAARNNLLSKRAGREAPSIDNKIIAAWNCMMLKAFTDAYAATAAASYLAKANDCAAFIEKNMLKGDGRIVRHFNNGKAYIDGFLDDYAWAGSAFERLYEVSLDARWLTLGKKITDYAVMHFWNEKTGLFFYSEKTTELVFRKTEIADDATPSPNAMLAKLLHTLGTIYDDSTYTNKALRMYQAVSARVQKEPSYHIQWSSFAGLLSAKKYEIVVVGKEAREKNRQLQQNFLPTSVVMGSISDENLPLLQHKFVTGKTLLYVCTDKLCKRPETEVSNALLQIK